MQPVLEQYFRDVISGVEQGLAAETMRAALGMVEPFYAAAVQVQFDGFNKGTRAARPVVSIGNITTGGTGKTPAVRWLTQKLLDAGRMPAILMRGYKRILGLGSDEQLLLRSRLPGTIVCADPSRLRGARRVLSKKPLVDVFVLDDGFQHRRIGRDFDLVLLDGTNPFGFGRVLPRGLLREPLTALARANAFLITHAELASPQTIDQITTTLRQHNPKAPVYRCRHIHLSLQGSSDQTMTIPELRGRRVVTFCGIGNPQSFEHQIAAAGAEIADSVRFEDHHYYTPRDLSVLCDRFREKDAQMLLTTEKDWVKLIGMVSHKSDLPPIWRTRLDIEFLDDDESKLLEQILGKIRSSKSEVRSKFKTPQREDAAV